jgi:gamma-glutamyltranspeptidase/glutathione hydrolase
MVVSPSEIATDIGVEILKNGGNAIDASVAVGFALSVCYPSAGNIGGGGFMVIHLSDGKSTTIDFRERAPLSVNKDIYLDEEGNYDHELSTKGWTSVGVPGTVAGLIYVLEKYGTMRLSDLTTPAIKLAENGFEAGYDLANHINIFNKDFNEYESSREIFTDNGDSLKENHFLVQKDLANTLRLIKENGINGFYKGYIADLIVKNSFDNGGYITYKDLEEYKPIERNPVTGNYKGYEIVSMPPPSSGGIALIQSLNILENFEFSKNSWGSSDYIHKVVESLKRVYADRSKHLGDPDFYDVPVEWLTSKEYAKNIFSNIKNVATPSDSIMPGIPVIYESKETTHYSIVDRFGNAVSTTVTLNSSYGNKIVLQGAGFLLNNEMDDFNAKPGEPNQYGLLGGEANSIQPGKRMLSSMTPTIVLKDDNPFIIAGSPGGSQIITSVLQVILNCIDFGMDIQKAIDMPRFHHQWFPEEIIFEEFGTAHDVKSNLILKGHKIGGIGRIGRVQGILIDNEKNIIFGGTDSRGFGKAAGY